MNLQLIRTLVLLAFAVLLGTAGPASAQAQTSSKPMPVSFEEFKSLAAEIAPKVNLFRDVWARDPQAEFFGGTSRDYLYWLKGRLIRADAKGELQQEIARLRAMEVIDVRLFILFESDVDVVSKQDMSQLNALRYGVTKIDRIDAKRFDPSTPEGANEIDQGNVPAEKIRLGKKGVNAYTTFGDGAREIYESKLTVSFAPDARFWETHYAKAGRNHPVLLALRYLRLVAMDYYQSEGRGLPNRERLFERMPKADQEEVARVIEAALRDPRVAEFMKDAKFNSWMNGTQAKAFRSYTSPEAALMLFTHFKAHMLSQVFGGIDPVNQTLFRKQVDLREVEKNLTTYSVQRAEFFESPAKMFSDGRLYHGTKEDAWFRSIIFQGVMPSEGGSAGKGLYGVPIENVSFAVDWGKSIDRVVSMEVSKDAKIVDVTRGEGKRVFSDFGGDYEKFAAAFGIDIVRYPYGLTRAVVVKNAGVLAKPDGYTRKLMPLDKIRSHLRAPDVRLTFQSFTQLIADNGLNSEEMSLLMKDATISAKIEAALSRTSFKDIWKSKIWQSDVTREILGAIPSVKGLALAEGRAKVPKLDVESFVDRKRFESGIKALENKFHEDGGFKDTLKYNISLLLEQAHAGLSDKSTTWVEDRLVKAQREGQILVIALLAGELAHRAGAKKVASRADGQLTSYLVWKTGHDYELWRSVADSTSASEREKTFSPRLLEMLVDLKPEHCPIEEFILTRESFFETPEGLRLIEKTIAWRGLDAALSRLGPIESPVVWSKKRDVIMKRYLATEKAPEKFFSYDSVAWMKVVSSAAPVELRDRLVTKIYRHMKSVERMDSPQWLMALANIITLDGFERTSIRHEVLADAEVAFKQDHRMNFDITDARGTAHKPERLPELLLEVKARLSRLDSASAAKPAPVLSHAAVHAVPTATVAAPRVVRQCRELFNR
ncbi:MAG: hypothetical protein AAB250_01085 [Bdellovibrionota bacterium]